MTRARSPRVIRFAKLAAAFIASTLASAVIAAAIGTLNGRQLLGVGILAAGLGILIAFFLWRVPSWHNGSWEFVGPMILATAGRERARCPLIHTIGGRTAKRSGGSPEQLHR